MGVVKSIPTCGVEGAELGRAKEVLLDSATRRFLVAPQELFRWRD